MKNKIISNKEGFNMFKRKINFVIMCFTMMFLIGMTSTVVNAKSMTETEPNNTMSTAQTITANNETVQSPINFPSTGQYVVNGYSSNTDLDWFKVYLKAGTNYLTCNGSDFDYLITDANGNDILESTYHKEGYGVTAYEFNVNSDGYYYVRITGILSTVEDYLFLVGGVHYSTSSTEIPCSEGTIFMNGRTETAHFYGSTISDLPEDAIAYKVAMSGIGSTSVDDVELENEDKAISINLIPYGWYMNDLTLLELPVSSIWTASFEYNRSTSFTPELDVYYVYPVYNTEVPLF